MAGGPALWAALSRRRRSELVESRIELLPPGLRENMEWVIDVGANEGNWLEALRRFALPTRVDAFEPNPEAFSRLATRFADAPNVHLHEIALGADEEGRELQLTGASVFSSLLAPSAELVEHYASPAVAVVGTRAVQVKTLDSVLGGETGEVSLLKIDVQGFEIPVLHGALACLARTRAVLIEMSFFRHYDGAPTFGALAEVMESELGFSLWDLAEPTRDLTGRVLWTDMLFVRRGLFGTRPDRPHNGP